MAPSWTAAARILWIMSILFQLLSGQLNGFSGELPN